MFVYETAEIELLSILTANLTIPFVIVALDVLMSHKTIIKSLNLNKFHPFKKSKLRNSY